jgi:glyoxylase-like metal-dependent hydrolase (beta-lactamase superfamily II)
MGSRRPAPGGRSAALRRIRAENPSPLTLDGTNTYIVGRRRVVIVDPGPDLSSHCASVVRAVGDAAIVAVVPTHAHPDHAAGAAPLARRLRAPVRSMAEGSLEDGAVLATDAGALKVLATPGHTRDHVALHWAERRAIFCGDLMLGGQDTALVAPPEGDLSAYLDSLARLLALRPRVIYPAHGPEFRAPARAIRRYIHHREDRQEQVLAALTGGAAAPEELLARVYGPDLDMALRPAAMGALDAYLRYLQERGRVHWWEGRWSRGHGVP